MAVKPDPQSSPAAAGQRKRRAVYGLNVAVAVAAALAVVVVLNGLINLPAVRGVLPRLDLTAGRTQTLSDQTQRTLDGLGVPVTLTAVVRPGGDAGRRTVALLDRYARHRPDLAVAVIDPDLDPAAVEAFYRGLDERFADETAPLRAAVSRGIAALETLTDDLTAVDDVFAGLGGRAELREGSVGDQVQAARVAVGETRARYAALLETLSTTLGQPVPPLANLRLDLQQAFRQADTQVLGPYRKAFAQMAKNRDAPMAVRDAMLKLDAPLTRARERLAPAIDALSLPADPPRFGRLQEALRAGEVVVVLSPDRERVLPVAALLQPGPGGPGGTGDAAVFVGEDRLTSALVTLGLEQPPRVIFARDSDQNVLAPGAGFSAAAGRLRTADYDVSTWRIGGTDPAANLLPAAAPGQTTVWVVPALSLERTTAADREQAADFLRRRLAAGDGVLLNRVYDADAQVRERDPLDLLAAEAGITPDTHVLLLRETVARSGRTQPTSAWSVTDYPEGAPLSNALAGRRLDFALPTPLTLADPARPLIRVTPTGTAWRAQGIQKPADIQNAAATDDTRITAPQAVAAYAPGPSGSGRLIVVGDGVWLGDGQMPTRLGNGELFVNAVNWLAGLDQAIAATPRVHDVRRLDAFDAARVTWVKLLLQAGLPAAALLAGVGVWWVRRRG